MPDNKINERLLRIRAIDELFSSKPGSTFIPIEIINHIVSKTLAVDYNRFKLARDIKFLEDDKGVRLKKEQVLPSSGVGRKITKYGYEDNAASIFNDNPSAYDILIIKDILEIFQLKGIDNFAPFVKFNIHYGKDLPKNYSPILSFTKDPSEKKISTKLNTLLTSIREKKVIGFKMNDRFDDSKITKHIVHPWYLREYNRRWYLFGWEGNNVEHYALDRMSRISKYANATYKCANISIDKILEDVIGINFKKDDKPEDIIFWVSNKSSNFVLSKPMHHTMAEIDYEEVRKQVPESILENLPQKGGVFIKMKCIINYELRREMMSFGEELIVLCPKKLRVQIKGILKKMCSNYD